MLVTMWAFVTFTFRAKTNSVFVTFVTFYELLMLSSPVAIVGDQIQQTGIAVFES